MTDKHESGSTLPGGVELLTAEMVWPTRPVLALVDAALDVAPEGSEPTSPEYRAALVDVENALPCKADLNGWQSATGQPAPEHLGELRRQAGVAGFGPRVFDELTPRELVPMIRGALERQRTRPTPDAPDTAGNGQDAAPAGGAQPEKPKAGTRLPKMPPEKARQAYWTRLAVGDNQTTIARKMTENGVPANQGQVSRWLRAVDAFLAAGGIMPPLKTLHAKPEPMAPEVLEMGGRQDGRTLRQRGKMTDPADDWD